MKRIIFILIAFISYSGCKDTVTDPVEQPGRRDYKWTIDTLRIPEGRAIPHMFWGANANNVWAIGMSYLNAYCIWHFTGIEWKNYDPHKYIDPTGIWGTSESNIWMVSFDGGIFHYDGSDWERELIVTIPDHFGFNPQNICGNSEKNVYAVGFADSLYEDSYKGVIMHFDGTKWKIVDLPSIRLCFWQIFYDDTSDKFLISALKFESSNYYIYSFDGTNLIELCAAPTYLTLFKIGKSIYIDKFDQKIYKYQNNNFQLFKDFTSTNYVGNGYGRSEKDFITVNTDGIGHYNGTDLITIFHKPSTDWACWKGIVFEKDLFFLWSDSYESFIVHGKLE